MTERLALIGAPSSAGAYAPGQEKAPAALRTAGLVEKLEDAGFDCADYGDTTPFRWRVDKSAPRAMSTGVATQTATEVAALVQKAQEDNRLALVIGGDCSIELGSVSGAMSRTPEVGLIYFDLDVDMNTPETTSDGALDWMGVAHLLGLPGVRRELAGIGPRSPMLRPEQILLFAAENITDPEQEWVQKLGLRQTSADIVAANPAAAASEVVQWASRFERVLIHLDVDVMDYEDFPIAENTRRKEGLTFGQTMEALDVLIRVPGLAVLTICEINPDHGLENGDTVRAFVDRLIVSFGGVSEACEKNSHPNRH